MRVLTVFAHPGSKSFCHAVLERFDAGLRDAGHANEIVDLYAIGFDPVLREEDAPNWMDADAPDEVIEGMHLRERMLAEARGPIGRFLVRRFIGDGEKRSGRPGLQGSRLHWLVGAVGDRVHDAADVVQPPQLSSFHWAS